MCEKEEAILVSRSVVDLFHSLPYNGKPKTESTAEFTVLTAITACKGSLAASTFQVQIITIATGTKCIGSDTFFSNTCGCFLHDSHAEVIARRSFQCYLLRWLGLIASNDIIDDLIESNYCPFDVSNKTSIKLREDWRYFLYTSDSPCGSASVYHTSSIVNEINEKHLNLTGAKLLPLETSAVLSDQYNGIALRTKSGRNDIIAGRRTMSLSCSDKICRWMRQGLQGLQ